MWVERLFARLVAAGRRLRHAERRKVSEFLRWSENTQNLIQLSILLFVPLLIGLVTFISNALAELSFLLFPPLASGAYTLFSDPEGKYASPWKFVAGLTVGALSGWVALELSGQFYSAPQNAFGIHPESAALSILLTGVVTWALSVEEPAAFSTALLVLVTERASPSAYVVSVGLFGTLVAVAFVIWREQFYEQRARYLYSTVAADDRVLVPLRGTDEQALTTALFGARLAAAHDAGRVVLLDVVAPDETSEGDTDRKASADDEARANTVDDEQSLDGERSIENDSARRVTTTQSAGDGVGDDGPGDGDGDVSDTSLGDGDDAGADGTNPGDGDDAEAPRAVVTRLETIAAAVRDLGVTCEVVVTEGDPVTATHQSVRDTGCDLIVTPYETDEGTLSSFIRGLFRGPFDTIAFRSEDGSREWKRVLVMVSRPGDSAHAMLDFADRLAGVDGGMSVCTCIGKEVERRPAETTLANLVETIDRPTETRVARTDIADYLAANADAYDLVIIGSSSDRSAASRFISPPTFERIADVGADVAVVDRGEP